MDLQLLAPRGVIDMDDFVLDWVSSFAFKNPDIKLGYSYRTGMATRKDAEFVPTPASTPQEVAMIDNYAELAATGNAARREEFVQASLETQEYLDAHWQAVGKRRRRCASAINATDGSKRGRLVRHAGSSATPPAHESVCRFR